MMQESKQSQPIRTHLGLVQPSSKYLGFIQRNKKTDELIKLKCFFVFSLKSSLYQCFFRTRVRNLDLIIITFIRIYKLKIHFRLD